MVGDVVTESERVLRLLVRPEVVDAFLLGRPLDEVEIRLAILRAGFPLGLGVKALQLVPGEIEGSEHILYDVPNIHVLKNLAVFGQLQQREPGNADGPVAGELALLANAAELAHDGVEVPLAAAGQGERDGKPLPDELRSGDRRILALQLQHHLERLAKLLGVLQRPNNERFLAQRRLH